MLYKRGENMAKSLYPYKEATITPAMMIVGTIIIIVMVIVSFLIMSVPPLA